VAALGGLVVERADLTRIASPHIEALQRHLGQHCGPYVSAHRAVLCIAHATDCQPDGCRPRLGELIPAHATAAGKALLAEREQWRETVLADPLERFTDRTITGREWLRRQLALTATRGYATEDREHRPETRALAVPVRAHDQQATAALALAAPVGQFPLETIREIAVAVTHCATWISSEFGFVSPS
jgi:IclR family transcriptional regulator, acetate operon repressor